MRYLAIAVLLAILVGAAFYTVQHHKDLSSAEHRTGWMQR
jgi:hypothetical protein